MHKIVPGNISMEAVSVQLCFNEGHAFFCHIFQAAKLGAKRAEEKSSGWFGGIFGGKKKKADDKASAQKDIRKYWSIDNEWDIGSHNYYIYIYFIQIFLEICAANIFSTVHDDFLQW